MRVIVDDRVHDVIENFYKVSLRLHPTLDEMTVERKKDRLYDALETLQEFPFRNAEARHKEEWKRRKYLVLICEDFLFGYKVYTDPETKEQYVYVHDVVYSSLYID